jgi:hypothetical protein
MKTWIAFFAALLVPMSALADDLADAKKAFETLIAYQKTDDERSLDLFSKKCVAKIVVTNGEKEQTKTIPTDKFLDDLKGQIAKKSGSSETYENIKYSEEGDGVRVDAGVVSAKNPVKSRLALLYRRDEDRVMRIHEFKMIFEVPAK